MISNHESSEEEDRISHLPGDVIECIMELLPTRDAVRTCVLSSKWRYVWPNHPSLKLDYHLWWGMYKGPGGSCIDHIDYETILNSILLRHVGHITTCSLSSLPSMPHSNIDLWLSSLLCSSSKLKKLHLNSNSNPSNRYNLPAWVFSKTSELINLRLESCYIGDINGVGGGGCFTNIRCLRLYFVQLGSGVLTAPFLTSLTIRRCNGILDFDIHTSALKLTSLILCNNDFFKFKPLNVTNINIDFGSLFSTKKKENVHHLNVVELLSSWHRISKHTLDILYFKYIAAGSIPSILEVNYLRNLVFAPFKMDSRVMPWILCMLKNSPFLHTFEIQFDDNKSNDIVEIEPTIMNFTMDQLCTVKIRSGFRASTNEVVFLKTLLQCAPVLEKLLIEDDTLNLEIKQRIHISNSLLLLQREFPKAEIIFGFELLELDVYMI